MWATCNGISNNAVDGMTGREIRVVTATGGGGTASATSDGAFADTPILAGDIDGNGVPEIITLEHWAPSYLPGGATTTVIALLRYELAGNQLVQVQRFEVSRLDDARRDRNRLYQRLALQRSLPGTRHPGGRG